VVPTKTKVSACVTSAGGLAPTTTSSGATAGEAAIAGPPPLTSSSVQSGVGFWHTDDLVYARVLLAPPVLSARYVPIYYALVSDEGQPADVFVEFSADGGRSFTPATNGPGGDGVSALSTAPSGTRHVFLWDAGFDLRATSAA